MQGRIAIIVNATFILAAYLFVNVANAVPTLKAVAAQHRMLQYEDNGIAKGPSAEIFKLLMEETALTANIDFYPWSRAYKTALERDNTLILSMVRTAEREDKFHWLLKVSELVRGFISLKSHPENQIRFINDAKSKTIAVLRNSYSYHSLIKLGFDNEKNIYEVSSVDDALVLFMSGKVDLIYTDPNVAINYFVEQGKTAEDIISVHILPQTRRNSYIAANLNTHSELLAKLKAGVHELKKSSKYHYFLNYKPLINE
jgi:ABC-type amino acid transport substrate-binding protein